MNFLEESRDVYTCDLGTCKVEVSDVVPHTPSGWAIVLHPSYPWNLGSTVLVSGLETSEEAIEKAPILALQFLQIQTRCSEKALKQVLASQPQRKHALERLVEDDGALRETTG